MNVNQIDTPNEYLYYFDEIIKKSRCSSKYPKIYMFYQTLSAQFMTHYQQEELSLFEKMSKLLAIDAQLQIIVECLDQSKEDFIESFEEEAFIEMVETDKKCYYRELSGYNMSTPPPWGLIYLSEDR